MHKHIKHLILLTIILVGLSSLGLIGCAENHKSYNINITIDGKPVNWYVNTFLDTFLPNNLYKFPWICLLF